MVLLYYLLQRKTKQKRRQLLTPESKTVQERKSIHLIYEMAPLQIVFTWSK